jgi:ArsR family transcriptional regulator, virulence genes transcriptional regulator
MSTSRHSRIRISTGPGAQQGGLLRDELYALHASFCQGLSDPKRLLIITALRDGEKSVSQLWQLIGARQSTVSQHLALMRHLGLVESRRADGNVLYRLADPRIAQVVDLLRSVHADLQKRRFQSLGTTPE